MPPRHPYSLEGKPPEPQGVGDDRDRAERHGGAGEDRAQQEPDHRVEDARRQRNPQAVVDEREEEVLADVPHRAAAEPEGPDDTPEVPPDERDPRALDRQ